MKVMGESYSSTLGGILGGIPGAAAGMLGFEIQGPLQCVLFGLCVMGSIGVLMLVGNLQERPEEMSLTVGLSVLGATVGEAASGALVGLFSGR
jgi:hypothetical protein